MTDTPSRIWSRSFSNITLSNGFFFSGFHMLLPTIPLLAARMGGSKTEVGLIAGIFVLSSVITRLFTDVCVEKFGKRACLLLGVLVSLVSAGGYLLTSSVEAMLWVRLLHGAGFGLGTTFYIAIVTEYIPRERRGEGLGYFGLATTVAMAVAPATGLWLADGYGFPAVFLTAAGCELLALAWLAGCALPSRASDLENAKPSRGSERERKRLLDVFVARGTLFPAFLTVLFGIGYGSVLNFIAVFAVERHIPNPGLFFIVGTTCIFLARVVMGRVYDRKGPIWVVLPGAASFLAGLSLIAATSSVAPFLTAAALYGFGVGALFPALQTAAINAVAPHRRSAASATFSNALDLGLGGGSVLLGLYAERAGLSAAYAAGAAVMIVFLVVYLGRAVARRAPIQPTPVLEPEGD